MMRAMSRGILGAALALSVGAGSAIAMPQEAFDAWKDSFNEKTTEVRTAGGDRDALVEAYNAMMNEITIADLTPSQIAWLDSRGYINYTRLSDSGRDYTDEALAVVKKAKKQSTAEGAVAATMYATLSMDNDTSLEEDVKYVQQAVNHPGVKKALAESELVSLNFLLAYQIHADVRAELKDEYGSYLQMLPNAAPGMVMYADTLYERVASLDALDERTLEETRQGLMALANRAIEASEVKGSELAQNGPYYTRLLGALEMAPKIASLVGNTAPEIDFTWSNTEKPLKHLADRRGKVLVLDFWATWCGPCVATFPNIRQLVEYYDGYPVEVIGVTSLQGSTVFGGDRGRVQAETPEAEYEQMAEYIDAKDITWTVAFGEQEVFNPEYGVRGIPHVVIIDPDGAIQHRGLHPSEPLKDKVKKINAILKDFDMPVPERAVPEDVEN